MLLMTATYSVEDNKLRLYASARLDQETYQRVKAAGFQWAPKQELFVAPSWTPGREDLLLDLCDEIEDEDYSATERAADRAERFGDYRDRRAAEAGGSADRFDAGPAAFGHQSRARAERQAARHDRHRSRAVSQWSKAEYWQERTAAVISHALYKSSAKVRRSRILRLEAEQRKHEKGRQEYAARFAAWSEIHKLEGADLAPVRAAEGYFGINAKESSPAAVRAYGLANSYLCGASDYTHPRTGRTASLYQLLTDDADPITAAEAAALWLADARDPADPEGNSARWSAHYENRLAYERAMLAEEGGTAADADMEPGGWIGTRQIQGVNRSPVTGKVVSVKLWTESTGFTKENGYTERATKTVLGTFNVERLPEGAYRAPTDEERERFKTATAERKKEEKAKAPKAPPLINPTDEDAQKLQDLWNAKAKARHDEARAKHEVFSDYTPTQVIRTTQAKYSANSGGSYSRCETVEVCEDGHPPRRWHDYGSKPAPAYAVACKIRKTYGGTGSTSSANAVIVITDKPQKPLPLDWEAIAAGTVQSTSFKKPEPAPAEEPEPLADPAAAGQLF